MLAFLIAVGILGLAGFLWNKPSMWQIQCLMTLLLLPFQLLLFDGLSLSSVLINILLDPGLPFYCSYCPCFRVVSADSAVTGSYWFLAV